MSVGCVDVPLTFTSREVCAAAGVSYRVLDYWVRAGAVTPEISAAAGSGSQRRWSMADVQRLTRLAGCYRRARAGGVEMSTATIASVWAELTAGQRWELTLSA